ncbi:deleted in malignant brain tumors 1 protein-like isoform X2 [Acanthaster planci]|nr:deleted in malignant brain tumors 1 protein-like isoform X2 [Acanthaster planci]
MVYIEFGGQQGAVCNDGFDVYAADVVCKQTLGSTSKATARFPPTSGSGLQVFLDQVECRGDESALMGCVHGKLGDSGKCTVENSAGVICWNPDDFPSYAKNHGIFRLSGGPVSTAGRVEVFFNGSWGSICDEQWDVEDADVLCKQLGCDAAVKASSGSRYGPGVLDIKLSEVQCDGTEDDMIKCRYVVLERGMNTTCTHEREAGTNCDCGVIVTIGDGQAGRGLLKVRLIGSQESEGTLCFDSFDLRVADVACREAGFPGALSFSEAEASTGPMLATSYSCTGSEISLKACVATAFNTSQCPEGKEVELVCQSKEGVKPTGATVTTGAPEQGGLSTGAIVGIVIGCLLAVVLIVLILFCWLRNKGDASGGSAPI